MKVCFLSSMHSPLDKRVFLKEARTLSKAGHEVCHLAPDESASERVTDGVTLYTYPRVSGILQRLLSLPRLYRRAKKIDADVYHCNELDSFAVGVALRLFSKKKCVLDVHEFYADDFAEGHVPAYLRGLARGFMRGVVRLLSYKAHAVVLANANLQTDYMHLDQSRVHYVENFGSAEFLSPYREFPEERKIFKLVHLGLFGEERGALKILEALKLSGRRDIEFISIGLFFDHSEAEFHRRVAEYRLEDQVKVFAWVPFEQMMEYLKTADMGLILFQPTKHAHFHALPHKLFDYMGAEIAIIAPTISERIAKIVEDAECGLLVDSTSPQSIASALTKLCENPEEMRRLGRNGRDALIRKYNWECEAQTLVSLYEML